MRVWRDVHRWNKTYSNTLRAITSTMSALEQPKCSDVINIYHTLEFDTYQSVLHPGKDLDAVVTNLDEFFVPKQNEVYA